MHYKGIPVMSALLSLLLGTVQAASITSTFDVNDEGWTGIPSEGLVAFTGVGGNPDGHIRVTDIGAGGLLGSGAIAPSKFLGDLSGFDNGMLSVDMATFGGGGATFPIFGTVRISGGGDSAQFDLVDNAPPFATWQNFSASLTAEDWGKTDSEWNNILEDVTEIAMSTDAFDGGDTIGVDNFEISLNPTPPNPGPSTIPEPSTLLLFGSGLAGLGVWRYRKSGNV